ncbi:hypothetical protein N7492_002408 [Penicillium capsulatum]|uniref:PRISE-like Rossmann-fold domain-containing protein n=1 Tax=Penicillium capsulatum TaxID=69766 RepID=A0A9W9LV43_9EURO|nr:hypothetical protein N7492_002408 [Penicillium capsulatum]
MAQIPGHAIVYGASGLIGWALVDQLLSPYPGAGTFDKVTAITNRPIDLCKSHWPEPSSNRPELQLVSGVDLRHTDGATLAESLKQAVKDIENVTHIYYLVFSAIDDDIEEVAVNRRMFQNVIDAHALLSPNLQFGYGIYAAGGTFTPPLHEDLVNTLPADYSKTVVYPAHRELLNDASKGKSWTWCEVCPDAVIGFTPNGSQFSLALHWAQYLSLYAHNHGIPANAQGTGSAPVSVPFPGNYAGATSLFSPVSSKTLARFMIYASLHPEKCGGGRLFNVADNNDPCTYGALWRQLAKWFGLEGVVPVEDSQTEKHTLKVGELPESTQCLSPGEYITTYKDIFTQQGRPDAAHAGVGAGNRQLDSVGYWLTFDRQMSMARMREAGFDENLDHVRGWLDAFEMFRKAGLIL